MPSAVPQVGAWSGSGLGFSLGICAQCAFSVRTAESMQNRYAVRLANPHLSLQYFLKRPMGSRVLDIRKITRQTNRSGSTSPATVIVTFIAMMVKPVNTVFQVWPDNHVGVSIFISIQNGTFQLKMKPRIWYLRQADLKCHFNRESIKSGDFELSIRGTYPQSKKIFRHFFPLC